MWGRKPKRRQQPSRCQLIGVAGSTGRLNGFERVNSYEALLEAAIALHQTTLETLKLKRPASVHPGLPAFVRLRLRAMRKF